MWYNILCPEVLLLHYIMNIFYLDSRPQQCAEQHCDKHVVKMILEYAQLLSTSHRVLDGVQRTSLTESGRKHKTWTLEDRSLDGALYKATHMNHPSAIWARQSYKNYEHLHELFYHLCKEYTKRYGKVHKSEGLMGDLFAAPVNIDIQAPFTEPPPAMPDYCKVPGNSVESYRKYYINEKAYFAKWKTKEPQWFVEGLINANV
jgi:hypothetical protein